MPPHRNRRIQYKLRYGERDDFFSVESSSRLVLLSPTMALGGWNLLFLVSVVSMSPSVGLLSVAVIAAVPWERPISLISSRVFCFVFEAGGQHMADAGVHSDTHRQMNISDLMYPI